MSEIDGHHSHRAGHRYVTAVHEVAGALPLLVPALGDVLDAEHLLDSVDGVLLTGGASNVEPHHYAGDPGVECGPHDPGRDGIAFNLVRGAVRRGIPLFGICRGHQEINVAFGGSLHPRLHEVPGRFDHRRPRDKPMEVQLSPRQNITLTPGGYLQDLLGGDETIMVNTLHGQGIDLLGQGLVVEAVADDSTVEAIRVADAKGFAVGVQWHPEYQAAEHRLYAALFRAFGAAVRDYASRRRGSAQAAE
jgi:putative glutamine amidotransferase